MESRPTPIASLGENFVAGAALLGAAAYGWFGWCVYPLSDWNDVRLAPAFALRHAIPLYVPLGGGPLSTWIYGPLTPLLNLPATFAPSAAAAIETAGLINLLTLIIPLILVLGSVEPLRSASRIRRAAVMAAAVLLLPPSVLVFQVSDHAANACGLLSCWCVARENPEKRIAGAALWTVLAMSAKQTAVFLLVGHSVYLLWQHGRVLVLRYLAWVAAFGAVAAVVCIVSFGFEPLWFNLVTIPSRLPWGDAMEKINNRAGELTLYFLLPIAVLIAWRQSAGWPDRRTQLGRLLRSTLCVFASLLPVGLLSFFKIGGDFNVLPSWYYLLPALVLGGVHFLAARRSATSWLTAAVVVLLAAHWPQWRNFPREPLTQEIGDAVRISRVAPGTVWFPQRPVVTFYSDGRLYHVEDGLATRHLAGFGIRAEDFRRHLPSHLRVIAYGAGYVHPLALGLLPEFRPATRFRDWQLYDREARGP